MLNLRILYEKNEDFKQYVDKYCKKTNITPEEAFTHYMIKDVARYYEEDRSY